MSDVAIRRATTEDLETLVDLTLAEAAEAEGADVDVESVRRGVATGLADPGVASYWVAESGGRIVGSISTVAEWSNFHGGRYWWVQSLYIVPEQRGTGLVERLLDHVAAAARAAGAIDLRLYVHEANTRARAAYRRCGFDEAPYRIMTRPLDR
jgi:ribosomal protein S18 acetylase RimI-like enzyme